MCLAIPVSSLFEIWFSPKENTETIEFKLAGYRIFWWLTWRPNLSARRPHIPPLAWLRGVEVNLDKFYLVHMNNHRPNEILWIIYLALRTEEANKRKSLVWGYHSLMQCRENAAMVTKGPTSKENWKDLDAVQFNFNWSAILHDKPLGWCHSHTRVRRVQLSKLTCKYAIEHVEDVACVRKPFVYVNPQFRLPIPNFGSTMDPKGPTQLFFFWLCTHLSCLPQIRIDGLWNTCCHLAASVQGRGHWGGVPHDLVTHFSICSPSQDPLSCLPRALHCFYPLRPKLGLPLTF